MTGKLSRILAALALAALAAGCAGAQRPLTPGEFYGFCWPAQIDYDCWDDSLCQTYRDYLEQEHASKEECIKGCNELQMLEMRQNAMRNCEHAIGNATDWCIIYCRRAFDYPQQKGGEVTQPQ